MPEPVQRRDELLAPYRHPYRHWLPDAWRATRTGRSLAAGAGAFGGGVVLSAITGSGLWVVLGFLVLLATLGAAVYATGYGALLIARRTRVWREPGELATVRARRPHAGGADPEVVHDEYAVTVEDSGDLVVWRFRPLPVDAGPAGGEVIVQGRPCHAAVPVEITPFDAHDAALAAEQLADAQRRAAELEDRAREEALHALAAGRARRELEAETRSTAEALRHLTGQRRR